MGIIQRLDKQTASKIAAGEVVERPLSVVKELLENSIDAGADQIDISIRDGGVGLIRVRDNGQGMDREDMLLSFERHATSKIKTVDDLYRLQTFGFRGEALPSIAAVAQVEMISCAKDAYIGNKLKISAGQLESIEEIGVSQGTIIEVRNLFYNLPARRKFLKSNAMEAGLIGELVSKYALGHPNIRFRLESNGQVQVDTAGVQTILERMAALYGEIVSRLHVLVPKTEFMPGCFMEACLIREEMTRNNRGQEVFFVNGRLIKSTELSQALEEGYYTLIPKGRFPIAVLHLQLPANGLDVNIHPAKTEIKMHRFELMKPKMVEIIKNALWEASITKNAFLPQYNSNAIQSAPNTRDQDRKSFSSDVKSIRKDSLQERGNQNTTQVAPQIKPPMQQPSFSSKESLTQNQLFPKENKFGDKIQEPLITYQVSMKTSDTKSASETLTKPVEHHETNVKIAVKDLSGLTLLGQLQQSFILAQNAEGLFIIDQHTCHERILYERFMAEENEKESISENLLIPISVQLTPKQDAVLVQQIIALRELGFVIEHFGTGTYLIRSIPFGLESQDVEGFFTDLLDDLADLREITPASLKEAVLTTASCKAAVKANWKLTDAEMRTLLHDLSQVSNAHTCPHGRPIIYKISMTELYKIFKRGSYQGE